MSGDLLSGGLGKKKGSEESSSPSVAVKQGIVGDTAHDQRAAGEDLLKKAAKGTVESVEESKVVETKESREEGSESSSFSDNWTLENALKEVKKVREEAKTYRLKYQEMSKQKEEELQAKLDAERSKYQEAIEDAKKLKEMEAKEADKKRTLEERLAHREKALAEYEARVELMEKQYKQQLETAQHHISELQAEREAQVAVYKERLDEELAKIPEDKREFANLLVKGAGDARDALIALNEAKLKGFFEDKKVVVNHSVPGAQNGARVSQKQLDDAEKDRRKKMSSADLIKEGLKKAGRTSSVPQMNKNSII